MHVPEGYRIPHLNTPRVPEGVDDAKVREHLLEKHGIEIAGGFGPLAGKIFRIGCDGADGERGLRADVSGQVRRGAQGGVSAMRVAVTFGKEIRVGPYEVALREAGIESVRNPASLESLDGLLLTGGSDMNPVHYGQGRLRESESPDDARDALESAWFGRRWRPIFRCSGFVADLQLLNVALRWHARSSICRSTNVHRQCGQRARNRAGIRRRIRIHVAPQTQLAEIIGAGEHEVNSRHHQAVNRSGRGLIVSATASDGVIEAIEKSGAAFAVAVQWHPEDRLQ